MKVVLHNLFLIVVSVSFGSLVGCVPLGLMEFGSVGDRVQPIGVHFRLLEVPRLGPPQHGDWTFWARSNQRVTGKMRPQKTPNRHLKLATREVEMGEVEPTLEKDNKLKINLF